MENYINRVELQGIVSSSQTKEVKDRIMVSFTLITSRSVKTEVKDYVAVENTCHQCIALLDENKNLSVFDRGNVLHLTGYLVSEVRKDNTINTLVVAQEIELKN